METNKDDLSKDAPPPPDTKAVPPPPDIKRGAPAPPIPSALLKEGSGHSGPPVKNAGLNVKIKEEDGGAEVHGKSESDNKASLGERAGGFLIDALVCVGLSMVLAKLIPFNFLDHLATLAAIAYLLMRDSLPFLHGQSLGKKVMGTRVETLDGRGLSENWKAGLLRNVALIVPPFGLVELGVLLAREDKPQAGTRLGDEWAKTRVLKIEKVAATEAREETEAGEEE